ncbi:MAG: DNA polymerase III subunit delta [Acidimicrobiia bacterium]|nr:DNA polymerase III subunit delta [Acidimicrobiia bacterium]
MARVKDLPVYLVRGDDPVLSGDAVRQLLADLVGDDDAAFAVEDLSGDDYEMAAVVEAAQTPPFFGDRRVVVARSIGRFSAQDVAPLVAYLADPLETTALVLVGGGGQIARGLLDAVKKSGHVVDAGAPSGGKARQSWLTAQLKASPVDLDANATSVIAAHLGEDVGRLPSLLELLTAAHGEGAKIGEEEVLPFLGEAGGVAPWDLTDAIDRGDTAAALENLHRLLGSGRHPLVILASLHNHYTRILRLEGSGAADEKAAAEMLGIKGSTFPARKALSQARRLGHDAVKRAIILLADADLALKGAIEWPDGLVLEVLVARLSRLGPRGAPRTSGTRSGSSPAAPRSRSRSPRGS